MSFRSKKRQFRKHTRTEEYIQFVYNKLSSCWRVLKIVYHKLYGDVFTKPNKPYWLITNRFLSWIIQLKVLRKRSIPPFEVTFQNNLEYSIILSKSNKDSYTQVIQLIAYDKSPTIFNWMLITQLLEAELVYP